MSLRLQRVRDSFLEGEGKGKDSARVLLFRLRMFDVSTFMKCVPRWLVSVLSFRLKSRLTCSTRMASLCL